MYLKTTRSLFSMISFLSFTITILFICFFCQVYFESSNDDTTMNYVIGYLNCVTKMLSEILKVMFGSQKRDNSWSEQSFTKIYLNQWKKDDSHNFSHQTKSKLCFFNIYPQIQYLITTFHNNQSSFARDVTWSQLWYENTQYSACFIRVADAHDDESLTRDHM